MNTEINDLKLHTDNDYKNFWSEIISLIEEMRELDPEKELVYGASSHQYHIAPIVPDKYILDFEKKNNILTPPSYRTYLQYFGDFGASRSNGTNSFLDDVSHCDVSKPSLIPIFEGVQYYGGEDDEYEEHPIECRDGHTSIAHGFNPCVPYMVFNGVASGQVYDWNYTETVWAEGDFALWYYRWAKTVVSRLKLHHKISAFPLGSKLSELQEAFPDEINVYHITSSNERGANGCNFAGKFILDENDTLVSYKKSYSMSDS